MCMRRLAALAATVVVMHAAAAQQTMKHPPMLGRPATSAEIKAWDISIPPDGSGLPPGGGTAAEGKALFARSCASCHGPAGIGGSAEELSGGHEPLTSETPDKTIGNYWPYATTLFDYTRRAMPMDKPWTLSNDQVYAITAYLLYVNGIIGEHDEMNARTLPKVKMPNRNGFIPIWPREHGHGNENAGE